LIMLHIINIYFKLQGTFTTLLGDYLSDKIKENIGGNIEQDRKERQILHDWFKSIGFIDVGLVNKTKIWNVMSLKTRSFCGTLVFENMFATLFENKPTVDEKIINLTTLTLSYSNSCFISQCFTTS
ncbi:hypothetical protein ACJX0J_027010, partial [Zea mays]